MRWLVVGGAGLVGSSFCRRLEPDTVHQPSRDELDVTDDVRISRVVERLNPDVVVNAAVWKGLDEIELAPAAARAVNVDGARTLARAAASVGARFVQFSADYVFDGTKRGPYIETDEARPCNEYGRSKVDAETEVLSVHPGTYVVRTSWVFGHERPNFVRTVASNLEAGNEVRAVDDRVGSPTLSDDLADAVLGLVRQDAEPGLYHVTNAGSASWYDLACAVRDVIAPSAGIEPVSAAGFDAVAERPVNTSLSSIRWEATGLAAPRPWQDALGDFLASQREVRSRP